MTPATLQILCIISGPSAAQGTGHGHILAGRAHHAPAIQTPDTWQVLVIWLSTDCTVCERYNGRLWVITTTAATAICKSIEPAFGGTGGWRVSELLPTPCHAGRTRTREHRPQQRLRSQQTRFSYMLVIWLSSRAARVRRRGGAHDKATRTSSMFH